jgi:hypothetical protein
MSATTRIARTVALAAVLAVAATAVAQAKPYVAPAGRAAQSAGAVPAGGPRATALRMSPDASVQWSAPPVRRYGTYMPTSSAPPSGAALATSSRATGGMSWAAVSLAAAIVMALLALGFALAGRARVRQA